MPSLGRFSRASLSLPSALLVACGPAQFEPTVPNTPPAATTQSAPPTPAPAPTAAAASKEPAKYPAEPKGPPPIPPPDGQGLSVKVQKYIVVDQFGYRTRMAKVAVLVDPVAGWNAADEYTPGG